MNLNSFSLLDKSLANSPIELCFKLLLIFLPIILLLFFSCQRPVPPEKTDLYYIKKYISDRLPKEDEGGRYNYYIQDSLHVNSLQSSIYRIHSGVVDATIYFLLLDQQTKHVYPILRAEWGEYNQPFKLEKALEIVENTHPYFDTEPTNYSFLHFEIFLNQCKAIQDKPLNYSSVDSIFTFIIYRYHQRIQTPHGLDSLLNSRLHLDHSLEKDSKEIQQRELAVLKKKLTEEGVFIYIVPQHSDIQYFEINQLRDFYKHSYSQRFADSTLYRNMYNLKVLRWWSSF